MPKLTPLLLAALTSALLAGCGGGDSSSDTTASTADTASTPSTTATTGGDDGGDEGTPPAEPVDGCRPNPYPAPPADRFQELAKGKRLPVLLAGQGVDLAAKVKSAEVSKRIEGTGSEDDLVAEEGRFAVVRYVVENRGDEPVQASLLVNARVFVRDGDGEAYGRNRDCPAQAAASADARLDSISAELEPGDKTTTVAAYVVPKGADDLRWTSPGTGSYVALDTGG